MAHTLSSDDHHFRKEFEGCRITPGEFNHRAHIRLAYIYLAENGPEEAFSLMRAALLGFLRHNGVPMSKYHETLTRAWILAVRHFMERSPTAPSADAFIAANPTLLDSKIMMTHYSAEVLFSEEARGRYVEADIDPIPHHEP